MSEVEKISEINSAVPQCQFFVVRKKRLCRMTVRPGRQYCGEHEPDPIPKSGQNDTRIPCPNDPKHTCYASKLEKHLLICNARQGEVPEYIVHGINAPILTGVCPRKPLSEIPKDVVLQLLDKIDLLYEKHVKDSITTAPEQPIHTIVQEEFQESDRTETSRRHLRQASSLLWLVETEGLVQTGTCYVELGAGRGQLSYYAQRAWCGAEGGAGSVVAVDRASPRHKRDGRVRSRAARLRADLAHLALHRAPHVQHCRALVGLAKHLCGAATDYALRCMTAQEVLSKSRGIVLATCCHHRCERAPFVGAHHLQALGISDEELNIMLGVVSWATCGDGRGRDERRRGREEGGSCGAGPRVESAVQRAAESGPCGAGPRVESAVQRAAESGPCGAGPRVESAVQRAAESGPCGAGPRVESAVQRAAESGPCGAGPRVESAVQRAAESGPCGAGPRVESAMQRARAGQRAKRLLDWARVQFLAEQGFSARLCRFVPRHVSPENICIVASKPLTPDT